MLVLRMDNVKNVMLGGDVLDVFSHTRKMFAFRAPLVPQVTLARWSLVTRVRALPSTLPFSVVRVGWRVGLSPPPFVVVDLACRDALVGGMSVVFDQHASKQLK